MEFEVSAFISESENMSSIVDQAKAAICALASNDDDANKWLMEFETSSDAWNVAQDLLLDSSGPNYRFHGANVFYNKIRRDFHQLRDR